MNSGRGKTIDNVSSIACSSPLRHDHLDPVGGAKGHAGKGRDDDVGGEMEAESPGDRRQQQGRLQQGEVVANADPRTAAEGEVGVASFPSDLLRWFGRGLLTRPSSSTDGLPVPDRWRVTCTAAHNAVGLAGESPVMGIDCLPT